MARLSNPEENESAVAQQPSNGKTIMLAEDDPFISRMYRTKLTGAGYHVVQANNGRDTLEQLRVSVPDLLMLDINMPELSGFDVIRALKADNIDLSMDRVMVLTNSANPEDRKTANGLGVEYFVKAEMTPREILNHINEKLGIRAS